MSEPDGAFMKLQIDRPALVRWLDQRPSATTRWSDWRAIGGQWYFDKGVEDIAHISAKELSAKLAESDQRLTGVPDNRRALKALIGFAEATNLRRASYDTARKEFVAGTLTYAENLIDFLVFLTVARGAADFLGEAQHGIVAIHNYVFGGEKERITQAALRLDPRGLSSFLNEADKPSAAGAFQAIADTMMGDPAKGPPPIDQLDALR